MVAGAKRPGPSPWAVASGALHALTLTALVFALAGRGGSPSLPAGQTVPHSNHAGRRLLEDGSARKLLGATLDDVDITQCISIVTESSGSGSNQVLKRHVKFSCPIVVQTERDAECNGPSGATMPCADAAKPAVSIVQGAQAVTAPLLSATPANSGNAAAFNGPITVDLSKYSTQNGWLDAIWIVQAARNAVKNATISNHGIHIKGNGGIGDNNAAFYVDGTTWMTGANAHEDMSVLNVQVKSSQSAVDARGPVSIDLSTYNTTKGWLDALWIVQAAPNAVKSANPPIPNHGIHIKGAGGAGDNNAAFYVDGTTWMTGKTADKDTSVLNLDVKPSQGAVDSRGPVSIDLSKYSTQNGWLDALWIVQAPVNAVQNATISNHGIHIKGNGGGNDNNGALYVAGNSYMMGTAANPTTPALFVQADRNQNGVQIAGRINPKVNALQVTQGFIDLKGGKTTVGELEAAAITTKVLTVTDRCNARSYYRGWPNSKPWN